jgi:voltage-dependent calcium channel alpha-2/delta-3
MQSLAANGIDMYIYSIVNSGAYRIINGTCAHTDSTTSTLAQADKCPRLRDIDIDCRYNAASRFQTRCVFQILPLSVCLLLLLLRRN